MTQTVIQSLSGHSGDRTDTRSHGLSGQDAKIIHMNVASYVDYA
jgi:hypothetical protein